MVFFCIQLEFMYLEARIAIVFDAQFSSHPVLHPNVAIGTPIRMHNQIFQHTCVQIERLVREALVRSFSKECQHQLEMRQCPLAAPWIGSFLFLHNGHILIWLKRTLFSST